MSKKNIVIGLLGTTLDQAGRSTKRWLRWRPSVSVCQQEQLNIDRFHLLYDPRFHPLAKQVSEDIDDVSPDTDIILEKLPIKDPWDFEEVYSSLLDFCENMNFDRENNNYFIHISTGSHVAQICLFLLTEARYLPGVLLQTSPTRKDESLGHMAAAGTCSIIDLDLAKYDRLASRFEQKKLDDISFLKSGIATRNSAFNRLIEQIETVAIRSPEPLLITGATGAGKSQLTRRIYELKKIHNQVKGEFVEINCATLRGDGAMSALFGHVKGAFTGALEDRPGLLKTADGGICFLDEIGELGLDEQAMLLRAIEEKTFLPLGANREVSSDFQLICGTNRDLRLCVKKGSFREDLLSRINLWTFELPSLKNRSEDIEPNIDYELSRYSSQTGRKVSFNKEARLLFLDYSVSSQALWSSNFRDLNGAIKRMATFADNGRITETIVKDEIVRLKERWKDPEAENSESKLLQLVSLERLSSMDLFDKITLNAVLEECGKYANLTKAGRALFSKSRLTRENPNDADRLGKYLKKYNIRWSDL